MKRFLAVVAMVAALVAPGVAFADGGFTVADAAADGWVQDGDNWTYWQAGAQVKGQWVVTATGPGIAGAVSGEQRYWIAQDGTLAISRVVDPTTANDANAYLAYATEFGYVATGRTVVGTSVYLARDDGRLETGRTKGRKKGFLTAKRYDPNGKKRLYYISPQTHATTYGEPVKVSKKFGYVYAPTEAGYLLRKSKRVDKWHVVLAQRSGRICNKKGWCTTSRYASKRQRYRLEPTAANPKVLGARVGYFKVKGARYRGLSKGYVLRNTWRKLGKTYYHVNSKGKFKRDRVVTRLVRRAHRYSSPSRYLIVVDVDNPRMVIFRRSHGKWKVKSICSCCTGRRTTPTATGTFRIGAKGYSFGEGKGYSCYYWTQIHGDYLFHTRLYHAYTHRLRDGRMGRRISHGCVRLLDKDALWIWRHAPRGTTVVCMR